jgi:hypothetical protein
MPLCSEPLIPPTRLVAATATSLAVRFVLVDELEDEGLEVDPPLHACATTARAMATRGLP